MNYLARASCRSLRRLRDATQIAGVSLGRGDTGTLVRRLTSTSSPLHALRRVMPNTKTRSTTSTAAERTSSYTNIIRVWMCEYDISYFSGTPCINTFLHFPARMLSITSPFVSRTNALRKKRHANAQLLFIYSKLSVIKMSSLLRFVVISIHHFVTFCGVFQPAYESGWHSSHQT